MLPANAKELLPQSIVSNINGMTNKMKKTKKSLQCILFDCLIVLENHF